MIRISPQQITWVGLYNDKKEQSWKVVMLFKL